ncbi:MAG: hypothetical protein KGI25_09080 [Thaumarchaeota archaeon]|nr:hypothetical protein [Nitrososphaerota archaeon]
MKYRIKKGTTSKVIEQIPKGNVRLSQDSWLVRRDLEFTNCLINSTVVKTLVAEANQGYALFGGDSGGDRKAKYIIAISYKDIEVVP